MCETSGSARRRAARGVSGMVVSGTAGGSGTHTHVSESEKQNGGVAQKSLGMRIGFLDASCRHQLVRTRHRRSVKPLFCIVYFPR